MILPAVKAVMADGLLKPGISLFVLLSCELCASCVVVGLENGGLHNGDVQKGNCAEAKFNISLTQPPCLPVCTSVSLLDKFFLHI